MERIFISLVIGGIIASIIIGLIDHANIIISPWFKLLVTSASLLIGYYVSRKILPIIKL